MSMNLAGQLKAGSNFKPVVATPPALSAAGTRNGSTIDRAVPGGVLYRSATLHTTTGAIAGSPTAQTVDAKVQHSADGSTWADYTQPGAGSAAAITQITAANQSGELDINLEGARRYIRVVETVAFTGGTSPTIGVCSSFILAGADRLPV